MKPTTDNFYGYVVEPGDPEWAAATRHDRIVGTIGVLAVCAIFAFYLF